MVRAAWDWSERAVGTNAIGTALVMDSEVQVFAAEHFVRSHHAWTCTAAAVHDPASGALVGCIDISGPAVTVSPTTFVVVRLESIAGRSPAGTGTFVR